MELLLTVGNWLGSGISRESYWTRCWWVISPSLLWEWRNGPPHECICWENASNNQGLCLMCTMDCNLIWNSEILAVKDLTIHSNKKSLFCWNHGFWQRDDILNLPLKEIINDCCLCRNGTWIFWRLIKHNLRKRPKMEGYIHLLPWKYSGSWLSKCRLSGKTALKSCCTELHSQSFRQASHYYILESIQRAFYPPSLFIMDLPI